MAEERIQAEPTKCLLFANDDKNAGAAFDTIDGDEFVTIDAEVEKAAEDDADASVAIEEYVGESAKDMRSDVPTGCRMNGRFGWSVNM
jgi:hypothetical protein